MDPPPSPAVSHSRAESRSSTSTSTTRQTAVNGSSSPRPRTGSPQLSSSSSSHSRRHRPHAGSKPSPSLSLVTSLAATAAASAAAGASPRDGDIRGNGAAAGPDASSPIPVSSFLLEKLRQERLAEGEKFALSGGAGTPARGGSPADGRRPRSSGAGGEPGAKKKGLGVKEMEQVMSTLHKQNFDLKLELYHRREKQSVLEEKVEKLQDERDQLEVDKAAADVLNEALMKEVDKRDKAVQEAVTMIIGLETQRDNLFREMAVLRELTGKLLAVVDLDAGLHSSAPRRDHTDSNDKARDSPDFLSIQSGVNGDTKNARAVKRIPSFLSVKSEATDNLRDVYLGSATAAGHVLTLASQLSLRRPDPATAAFPSEAGHVQANRLSSSSLSVLSESSFVSVYGRRSEEGDQDSLARDDHGNDARSLAEDEQQSLLEGAVPQGVFAPVAKSAKTSRERIAVTPTKRSRSRSRSNSATPTAIANKPLDLSRSPSVRKNRSQQPGQFRSITDIIDQESPLRRLEQLDRLDQHTAPGPTTTGSPAFRSSGRSKEEKREAVNRALANAHVPLGHASPPTPDTISSSTLRRYKNSDDGLFRQQQPRGEQAVAGSSSTASGVSSSTLSGDKGAAAAAPPPPTEAPSSSRRTGKGPMRLDPLPLSPAREAPTTNPSSAYWRNLANHLPPRPRSADETTVSRRGGWSDSDEDEDEEYGSSRYDGDSDAHSLESSLDIWLREGWKANGKTARPSSVGPHPPIPRPESASPATATTLRQRQRHLQHQSTVSAKERRSPDLFGISSRRGLGGAWDTDAVFGTGGASSSSVDTSDEMLPVQAALFATSGAPPPPPDRRSSLTARTGSSTGRASLGTPTPRAAGPSGSGSRSSRSSQYCDDRGEGGGSGGGRVGGGRGGSGSGSGSGSVPVTQREMKYHRHNRKQQQQHRDDDSTPSDGKRGGRSGISTYPPISGSMNRPRGINNIFRRSISGAGAVSSTPSTPSSETRNPVGTPAEPLSSSVGSKPATGGLSNIGIPSWIRRGSVGEDERATPPPIMRNRSQGLGGGGCGGGGGGVGGRNSGSIDDLDGASGADAVAATDGNSAPGNANDAGTPSPAAAVPTRRKWLAFGRSNSLRSRGAG